jgi:hypothetical protein
MSESGKVKSKISAFEAIRSRCVDFGITTSERCRHQRNSTCAGVRPSCSAIRRTVLLDRCLPVPSGLYASGTTSRDAHASSSARRYRTGLSSIWLTAGGIVLADFT